MQQLVVWAPCFIPPAQPTASSLRVFLLCGTCASSADGRHRGKLHCSYSFCAVKNTQRFDYSDCFPFSWAYRHFLAQPEWFAGISSILSGQASKSQHLQFKIVNSNHKHLVNDNTGQNKTPLTVPAAILEHLEKGQFWDLFWHCPDVKL